MNPIYLIIAVIFLTLAYLGLTHNWGFTVDYLIVSLSFTSIGIGIKSLIDGVVNE